MFVYNAYNNLEEALGASELYDPYKASLEIERLRKIKYSATFKPLVDFVPRDGFHQLFRLKLNSPAAFAEKMKVCLLYTSPSPRDLSTSRMPSSA